MLHQTNGPVLAGVIDQVGFGGTPQADPIGGQLGAPRNRRWLTHRSVEIQYILFHSVEKVGKLVPVSVLDVGEVRIGVEEEVLGAVEALELGVGQAGGVLVEGEAC